jgi:hypothetical protein
MMYKYDIYIYMLFSDILILATEFHMGEYGRSSGGCVVGTVLCLSQVGTACEYAHLQKCFLHSCFL